MRVNLKDELAGNFWQGGCASNILRWSSALESYEGRITDSAGGFVHVSNRSCPW